MERSHTDLYTELMLDEILSSNGLKGLVNGDAFEMVGQLIDLSDIFNRVEGSIRALELCDDLSERKLDDGEETLLHYFRSNAWAGVRKDKIAEPNSVWSWEQPELLKELFHLRSAIRHLGFKQLDEVRRCQILTNTANLLNTVGRSTEAVEYWNRALEIVPHFGMALGNRGYGLMSYARTLYDVGHAITMMKFAHDDLRHATSDRAFFEFPDHEEVKEAMAREADGIATHVDLEKVADSVDLEGQSLGRSREEKNYRRWCLHHRLFLTPLNDLGPYPIAALDILTLPNLVTEIKEPPSLIGFYNQLKQEYIAARYFYYEGKEVSGHHYADHGVLLYDTLDYPAYSVSVEKVKSAFRMAYSLFDKIAFFINVYWLLGMAEKSINFRSIWHTERKKGSPSSLRECFSVYENWPLRGLYWLSKDLLESGTDLAETMEPDAEALNIIRNHLEHKYLKVHDQPWTSENHANSIHDAFRDSMAYSVTRDDLEAKALRLLKLGRAGLIYLSLAVHREERLRTERRGNGLAVPMMLNTWPDDWKR